MDCKQARQQIADISQPEQAALEVTQHTAQCGVCGRLLEERTVLHAALARLRAETAGLGPSESVEEHVLAALNEHRFNSRPAGWNWPRISASALAVAAVLLLAVLITGRHGAKVVPAQTAAVQTDEPFTAMPYVVPPAPYERTAVVRTEVSMQVMLAAGFQVHGEDLGSTTPADVLYGEDGRILALRLISQPNSNSDKRMD